MRLDGVRLDGRLFLIAWLIVLLAPVAPAIAACTDPPAPGVDWRRCNFDRFPLAKVDLTGATLDNASFNWADLSGSVFANVEGGRTRFARATLTGVDFSGANLRDADFSQADLQGASFADANLIDVRFHNAKLQGADFSGARIRDADFFRADLSGATWIDGERVCAEGSNTFCR